MRLTAVMVMWACALVPACKEGEQSEEINARGPATQQMAPDSPTMQRLRSVCPVALEDVDVAVEDTTGGVALIFTTDTGDLVALRQRAENLAQMYTMHRGRGYMSWHHMNGDPNRKPRGWSHMAGRGPMPAASTILTEIENGARLELTPTDPSQLDALREYVRWHQQRMQSGQCWILQNQPSPRSPGAQQ